MNATLEKIDGTVLPLVWRPLRDDGEPLLLYTTAALEWVATVSERSRLR